MAGDGNRWAIADDAAEIAKLAARLGIQVGPESWIARVRSQSIFHTSQFSLLGQPFVRNGNRLGVAYLHGRPGTQGHPEFDTCYETLERRHDEIDRVQVSSVAMQELVLGTGIAETKVWLIPIGVDTDRFRLRDAASREESRRALGIPESAFVVGSFQKDGVGWGEGTEPKLIKGPDVLIDVAARVAREVPELVVLLTGPARGFVAAGLAQLGVAHVRAELPDLDAVAAAYRAVDVCLVTSRDEGGPKAVLESMATGVPLVTTRVGQAADLVSDGETGRLLDVDDSEGIAEAVVAVRNAPAAELERLAAAARARAEACSWGMLSSRWSDLFTGFVAMERA
ncbi:MAG TPA: glycosyltransferase family 4 protein [Gaiellaceae bacterium]|nr:glycosyltransferase family 4 protein [Gaiellaceae bacterium]